MFCIRDNFLVTKLLQENEKATLKRKEHGERHIMGSFVGTKLDFIGAVA